MQRSKIVQEIRRRDDKIFQTLLEPLDRFHMMMNNISTISSLAIRSGRRGNIIRVAGLWALVFIRKGFRMFHNIIYYNNTFTMTASMMTTNQNV